MSKLDYVTIAIVGICIMAILFLVYKMTNVFNGNKEKPATEIAADSTEAEDEDVYDYEIDQNVDSTGTGAGSTASDKTSATQQPAASTKETSASSAPAEDDAVEEPAANTTKPAKTSAGSSASDTAEHTDFSEGKYMVLAGSFSKKAGAEAQVKSLKKLGYDNAKLEIFDRGKFAVVVVDRFDNMADAERLVKKLNGDSVKSYVKAKS